MDLGTVFKFSLYGLVALVGIILGAAESEGVITTTLRSRLFLPFLSVPIVIFSYLLTERRNSTSNGFGINAIFANFLGVIALIATVMEFTGISKEGKLLAGTHLLVYVTWIVLLQRKTLRLYWFLMALGILQIAVASVLTNKGWFGFAAMLYMFCAVWTLSIFSLWRAQLEIDGDSQGQALAGESQPVTIEARRIRSRVQSAIKHENGSQWLTGRFVSGVLMTGFAALFVSAAFFAFVPRIWLVPEVNFQNDSNYFDSQSVKQGLATSVKLGDFGPALESLEKVFEISLTDINTKQPISVQEYAERLGMHEPLFRGAVLINYKDGEWTPDTMRGVLAQSQFTANKDGRGRRQDDPRFLDATVQQDVRMESSSSGYLFCLDKPVLMSTNRPIRRKSASGRTYESVRFGRYDEVTGVANRGEPDHQVRDLEYQAFTVMPKTQQSSYKLKVVYNQWLRYIESQYLKKVDKPPQGLDRLKELAHAIVEQEKTRRQRFEQLSEPRELSHKEIAEALETYLRDSGQYKYSLDMSINDPKIDPVEDFLFNRKQGHCEYFATALVLMMRAEGVPSRIVSGYKGGLERPDNPDILEVQQRYSHLWAEAWVDGDGWTTYDATPVASRTESIEELNTRKTSLWSDVQTTLSSLWSESILNMSLDRQEASIYGPLRELAYTIWNLMQEFFISPEFAFQSLWDMLTNRESRIGVSGRIIMMMMVLALGLMIWLISRARFWSRTGIWDLGLGASRQREKKVEFYQRFLQLLKQLGMDRQPSQTPLEFAEQVTSSLPALSKAELIEMPSRISRMFYRVRFGEEELSEDEAASLEVLLSRLENVVKENQTEAGQLRPSHV